MHARVHGESAAFGKSAAAIDPVFIVGPGVIDEPIQPALLRELVEVGEHFPHQRDPGGVAAEASGVAGGQPPFGEPACFTLSRRPTLR